MPPLILLYAATALAGLLAGGGINVLADRVTGVDEPFLRARQCRACLKPLPRPPFFALGDLAVPRRCPLCGHRVSLRRPVLQLCLAVASPLLLAHLVAVPPTRAPIGLVFTLFFAGLCDLAFIFAVDLEHRLIYDLSIYPLALVLLASAAIVDRRALVSMALAAAIAGGLFLLLYLVGFVVYRQEALGFGDVKLAALIGLLVGWQGIIIALGGAALSGGVVSLLLLGLGAVTSRTFIPFGVYLVAGTVAAMLLTGPIW